jgi:outer membrane protein assembly factor BamB
VLGVIAAVVILTAAGVGVFAIRRMNSVIQDIEDVFAEPEPILYDYLPVYANNEKPYFHPADLGDFTEITHFKEISTWLYDNEVPILIADNALFLAGQIQPDDGWGSINVDLFRVNMETGKVDWQARAGSAWVFTDGRYLFTEAVNNYGAAGIVAFDIKTGEQIWETRFDYEYAVGIGSAILNESSITVETYHHGNTAVFVVDKESGRIISQEKNAIRTGYDLAIPYNDLVLEKEGSYPGSITAYREDNHRVVWQSEETAVGNFAVSGSVTYFLTESVQLLAVDTNTGNEIGKLTLAPRFLPDFDFVNSSIIVAADENFVALYFEETRQLSIYKFNPIDP